VGGVKPEFTYAETEFSKKFGLVIFNSEVTAEVALGPGKRGNR
jgi:hypothetical protein